MATNQSAPTERIIYRKQCRIKQAEITDLTQTLSEAMRICDRYKAKHGVYCDIGELVDEKMREIESYIEELRDGDIAIQHYESQYDSALRKKKTKKSC